MQNNAFLYFDGASKQTFLSASFLLDYMREKKIEHMDETLDCVHHASGFYGILN
jgi:hypothetical protein